MWHWYLLLAKQKPKKYHNGILQERVRYYSERPDGQRRHLLPNHGEKAAPRPRDCGRKSAAVYLSRGQRRSQSTATGWRFPRQDALRTDLLQPGEYECRWNSADCRCNGQLHRRFVMIFHSNPLRFYISTYPFWHASSLSYHIYWANLLINLIIMRMSNGITRRYHFIGYFLCFVLP